MTRGSGRLVDGVTATLMAMAGAMFAVVALLMLRHPAKSDDAPFWAFPMYAGIALAIAVALWAGTALTIKAYRNERRAVTVRTLVSRLSGMAGMALAVVGGLLSAWGLYWVGLSTREYSASSETPVALFAWYGSMVLLVAAGVWLVAALLLWFGWRGRRYDNG